MTNPRDTGRYDATTDTWIDTNVRVDFAWGNFPIQPNDDRGANVLDAALDNHVIATDGWSSFPEFEPNTGFDPSSVLVFGPVNSWSAVSSTPGVVVFDGFTQYDGMTSPEEADVVANPSTYKVVVTGGSYPGEATAESAFVSMGRLYVRVSTASPWASSVFDAAAASDNYLTAPGETGGTLSLYTV